jgi:hypothetical protein
MRPVNKRGSIINGDLANIRTLLAQGMQSPSAEEFVHDGELLCAALASAVHVGEDPGPELERASRGFMAFSRTTFSSGAVGAAVGKSGLSTDEAIAAIRSGEWDPFADVEMPRH